MQPDEIGADFVPRRREGVEGIEIEGEGIVFDAVEGSWHHLNSVAQLIWACCDGQGSLEDIACDIADAFSQDLTAVRESVTETIRQFGRQGLLEGIEQEESTSANDHQHPETEHRPDVPEVDGPRFLAVPPNS